MLIHFIQKQIREALPESAESSSQSKKLIKSLPLTRNIKSESSVMSCIVLKLTKNEMRHPKCISLNLPRLNRPS